MWAYPMEANHTTENVSLSYGGKCNDTDVIVEQGSQYMAYHANWICPGFSLGF